jgi:hypothetical protein
MEWELIPSSGILTGALAAPMKQVSLINLNAEQVSTFSRHATEQVEMVLELKASYSGSRLMLSLIVLSIGLCDQINEIPNTALYSCLCLNRLGYYYHSVNIISMNLSQSDHNKWLAADM